MFQDRHARLPRLGHVAQPGVGVIKWITALVRYFFPIVKLIKDLRYVHSNLILKYHFMSRWNKSQSGEKRDPVDRFTFDNLSNEEINFQLSEGLCKQNQHEQDDQMSVKISPKIYTARPIFCQN
jgi:hypothetical protein